MKPGKPIVSKGELISALLRTAAIPPERTRGSLKEQIRACKLMASFGYEPALKRLNEISTTDPARTKGHRRDQDAAAKMLKTLLNTMKIQNSEIQ